LKKLPITIKIRLAASPMITVMLSAAHVTIGKHSRF
jgi:hypothetical protein